jgi:hypothetical protein
MLGAAVVLLSSIPLTLPERALVLELAPPGLPATPPLVDEMPKPPAVVPCSTSYDPNADTALRPGPGGLLSADGYWTWPTGSELDVGFVDGSPAAREAVAAVASEWAHTGNFELAFHVDAEVSDELDIIVLFGSDECRSEIGPSSREPTGSTYVSMQLCHVDHQLGTDSFRRVVLHEFGHALGLGHAAQTEPESIMQPFALRGPHGIAAIDREHVAALYPRRSGRRLRHYDERRVVLRNDTDASLEVEVTVKRVGGSTESEMHWPSDGRATVLPPHTEQVLPPELHGQLVIVDTKDVRSDELSLQMDFVRIARDGGYYERAMQYEVLSLDAVPYLEELGDAKAVWNEGHARVHAGRYAGARDAFYHLASRFPFSRWVTWARLAAAITYVDELKLQHAAYAIDAVLEVDGRGAAARYARFYGGVIATMRGDCGTARKYFAVDPGQPLPRRWAAAARAYVDAIEADPEAWCRF